MQKAESRRLNRRKLHKKYFCLLPSAFCLILQFAWVSTTSACPFCVAVKPTLMQQRESAEAAFLAECQFAPADGRTGKHEFAVHRLLSGKLATAGQNIAVELDASIKPGTLALLLAEPGDQPNAHAWRSKPLSELGFAYVARAPDLRTDAAKRLAYFAPFLEHADPLVAEDAYLEFGHAPFDVVEQAAGAFNVAKLRDWIVDPAVPSERKAFYGLALGLTAKSAERAANVALLEKLIAAETRPGDDFRTGFDGLLAGYLVAKERDAIDLIAKQFFTNPKSAVGDVKHAHKALRFFHEFGPPEQREAIAAAVEKLLDRPADAAAAITDLARWRDWSVLPRVASLFDQQDFTAPDIRRAIVGYLRACPLPTAEQSLSELRKRDPNAVAAAEASLDVLSGK
jgi:hypothetical protein